MGEQGAIVAVCMARRVDRPIKPQNLLLRLNHSKQLHQQQHESSKQMESYIHKCCQLGDTYTHTYIYMIHMHGYFE